MAEVVKIYKQQVPAVRFIGRKYGVADANEQTGFAGVWGKWFQEGLFDILEKLPAPDFEDADAYIAVMHEQKDNPFEYWIGMFRAQDAECPDGFVCHDFKAGELCVAWLKGKEQEVYAEEDKCSEAFVKAGYDIGPDKDGARWFFERYGCPRFTTPDADGNIVLDICRYAEL